MVTVSLNPGFRDFRWTLDHSVPLTLAHELHHSARVVDGPGYGTTLRQAIVSEGLADVFSLEVYPDETKPPWVRALDDDEMCRWWTKAQDDFYLGRGYSHREWFFGAGNVPRWAGYRLGFELVTDYLERHPDSSAARLVHAGPDEILEGSSFCDES